jgi:Tfp pilus assembly protein PilF
MGESGRMPYKDAFSRQKTEAAKAIQSDSSLPEGHAELANAAMTLDWDWKTAATEFQQANNLNPNSAPIHAKYAFYLARTGQMQEAITEVERGVDLDPDSWRVHRALGEIDFKSGQYEEGIG